MIKSQEKLELKYMLRKCNLRWCFKAMVHITCKMQYSSTRGIRGKFQFNKINTFTALKRACKQNICNMFKSARLLKMDLIC